MGTKTDGAFESAMKEAGESLRPSCTCVTDSPLHDIGCPQMAWDVDSLERRQAAVDTTFQDSPDRFVPQLRQKTSAERKAEPIHSGPMSYHPDALAAHARLCVAGNTKHNGPGTPLSWARGKSNDHLECAARHMLTPDAIDPETGETELTAAFWRLGCALQLQQERLLKEKGIMPYSGITP